MAIERTLAMVKPDAMRLTLYSRIMDMYREAGLKIVSYRAHHFDEAEAGEFYREHQERPFFLDLVKFMTSEICMAMVIEGENAVKEVRRINGATNPLRADPESIRGKYQRHFSVTTPAANFVHGSDSPEAAHREIGLIFGQGWLN